MYISNIEINNFKTFDEVNIDLNKFNVLVGPCASGKSNFITIFEFLKNMSYNFHDAIKSHGQTFLKNLNVNKENARIKVTFKRRENENIDFDIIENTDIVFNEFTYEINFKFTNNGCIVQNDGLYFEFTINDDEVNNIIIKNDNGEIDVNFKEDIDYLDVYDIIPSTAILLAQKGFKNKNIPLINSVLTSAPFDWIESFRGISSYDFNTQLCKSINAVEETNMLTKHGGNLHLALIEILNDEKKKELFLKLFKGLLPYIEDICVEKILGEDRIFMIIEEYTHVKIPAPFISDGTSSIIAIIIAVYFQSGEIILIEEPERHIHPMLLYGLIGYIEEIKDKQVIITTHSQELLKDIKLENLLYIRRDFDGISKITNVGDNTVVKPFIEDFGVDEVFLHDYLDLD